MYYKNWMLDWQYGGVPIVPSGHSRYTASRENWTVADIFLFSPLFNQNQMQIEWKINCVCCNEVFTGYTDLSRNRSRWLANIAYLESRGLAACRATSSVSFIASMNWAPLPPERFKNKREQRQNNWSYFQEQKHNMRGGYFLHFFLSWSCEDLSPVVSFCFVRLWVTFSMAQTGLFDCRQILLFTPVRFLGWPHCIILKNPRVMSVSDVLFHPTCSHRPQISFMPASCR